MRSARLFSFVSLRTSQLQAPDTTQYLEEKFPESCSAKFCSDKNVVEGSAATLSCGPRPRSTSTLRLSSYYNLLLTDLIDLSEGPCGAADL